MPRGVYDRSKLKTATTKTKTEAAPAAHKPKGKPGRKPGSVSTKGAASTAAPTQITKVSGNELELFATVRANLDTLNALSERFSIPSISTEVTEHIEVMGILRKKVFGTKETAQAPVEVKTTAKVVEAPVTASNGTTQTAYPASVPMPPAPIPSIPTQS